jgi:hypothetical protein
MIIYKTIRKYRDIPINTLLKFNKSNQYFETFDHKNKITNDDAFWDQMKNGKLLIVDHEIIPTNTQKSRDWNPFNKDIKDWKKKKI